MVMVERQDGVVVVGVVGHLIVGNRRELQQHVADALEAGAREIVVDLAEAGYVDSAGLGTLVMLAKRARTRGAELRLTHLNDDLKTLFRLTKLDTLFPLDDAELPPAA